MNADERGREAWICTVRGGFLRYFPRYEGDAGRTRMRRGICARKLGLKVNELT